ncbi:AAA domain-containing protein [Phaeosphaeriaceae sp. PMI808]|nr:AAA domain-containing protein [Phaeosphaeriaceae sp. PMI808]
MNTVYVIGAQSTGKTTLVNAIEEDFNTYSAAFDIHVIREVARTVLREKGFDRLDITNSPSRALQLQIHILEAQYNAEMAASALNESALCICDRSGLDPIVYARLFVGPEAMEKIFKSQIWLELETRMKEGIVILCEAGCSWLEDDGVRLMPNDAAEWMRVDAVFRQLLKSRGIPYHVVPMNMLDLGERVDFVRSLVAKVGK